MMRIYKMPNGIKRQFEEGKAPEGAVLVTKVEKTEEKVVETEEKVKAPKTKVRKGIKK